MQRRDFLRCCGTAAASFGLSPYIALAAEANGGHPLAPGPAHFDAKAKNLLFVFLSGGFSHVDTFDYKPKLKADAGKVVDGVHLRGIDKMPLMGSPFEFKQ